MKKALIIMSLFVVLIAGATFGDSSILTTADNSPAFYLYNYGYTGDVVVVITTNGAGNNMSVTCDGLANTVDGSGTTDTIDELCAAISACTNRSGEVGISCLTKCSLGADSTDGELLDGTYTATAGTATSAVLWDTSECKFYSAYINAEYQPVIISEIFGNPLGTGAVTLSVYDEQTLVWQDILYEDIVVSNTNDANTVTLNNGVDLPVSCGVTIALSDEGFIRASRATTATTGNIGGILKP